MAGQDYLKIAREFKESPSNEIAPASNVPAPQCEISELCEISPFFEGIDDGAVARAYDTKATVPGQKPPLQQLEEQQAWLATIDWRQGLRCGLSGRQCKVCKGIPCHGSTEWEKRG